MTAPPDNLEQLTKAFKEYGEMDNDQRNTLGNNSRVYAMKNLTPEVNLNKVVEAIKNILS